MTKQSKELKQAFEKWNVTLNGEAITSIKTPKNKKGEFIEIKIFTDLLTEEQKDGLIYELGYIEITDYKNTAYPFTQIIY